MFLQIILLVLVSLFMAFLGYSFKNNTKLTPFIAMVISMFYTLICIIVLLIHIDLKYGHLVK